MEYGQLLATSPPLAYSFGPFRLQTRALHVYRAHMARITVEDCLHNVDNLFQLVLLAAQRARRLANGAEPTLSWENDKPTVVALREIAAGNITVEMLREPEPPPVENTMTLDEAAQSTFRAPQFGLGD